MCSYSLTSQKPQQTLIAVPAPALVQRLHMLTTMLPNHLCLCRNPLSSRLSIQSSLRHLTNPPCLAPCQSQAVARTLSNQRHDLSQGLPLTTQTQWFHYNRAVQLNGCRPVRKKYPVRSRRVHGLARRLPMRGLPRGRNRGDFLRLWRNDRRGLRVRGPMQLMYKGDLIESGCNLITVWRLLLEYAAL